MKVEILNHREFVQRAFQNTPRNLIFISSPQYPFIVERSREAVYKVPNKLVLLFDDLQTDDAGPNAPGNQQIRDAIQFGDGLDDLVVSCSAGVSRSAAIAFGVVARHAGIEEAFSMLNPQRHSPNSLIISHIQEILDLPFLSEAMESWIEGDQKELKKYIGRHHEALHRRSKSHS